MTGKQLYMNYSEQCSVFKIGHCPAWEVLSPIERAIWKAVAAEVTRQMVGIARLALEEAGRRPS